MPISEDEYDSRQGSSVQSNQHHNMTKAELRRSNKPIMEKKRRARINHCLNELKSLILDAMKKDPARHSKLEKADILEMTVRHLQSVQRRQQNHQQHLHHQQQQQLSLPGAGNVTALTKFRGGFGECAQEVAKCASTLAGPDAEVARRLVAHLENCVSGLSQISAQTNNNTHTTPTAAHTIATPVAPRTQINSINSINSIVAPIKSFPPVAAANHHQAAANSPNITASAVVAASRLFRSEDVNDSNNNNNSNSNNTNHQQQSSCNRIQMGAVQLIPSRLPTGELALVLPHSSNLPFFPSEHDPKPSSFVLHRNCSSNGDNKHQSAFSAVISSSHLNHQRLEQSDVISSHDQRLYHHQRLQNNILTPLLSPADTLSSISNTSDEDDNITNTTTAIPSMMNKAPIRQRFQSPQQSQITSTTMISPESLKLQNSSCFDNAFAPMKMSRDGDDGDEAMVKSGTTGLWVESVQRSTSEITTMQRRKRDADTMKGAVDEDDYCYRAMKAPRVSSTIDTIGDDAGDDCADDDRPEGDERQRQQLGSPDEMWRPW